MVTVKLTSEKTLDTPEEIAAFLQESYADLSGRSAFKPGDVVSITSRAGMMPDFGVGDVGVVVFSEPAPAPFTHLRLLHANGSTMTIQVQTANLGKRDAA
jgi:hypothetical protein